MLTGIGFGAATFIEYMILIGLRAVILRRNFKPWQLLQIGASFLTSFFIDIYDTFLPAAQSMAVRLVLLAAAIVIAAVVMLSALSNRQAIAAMADSSSSEEQVSG